jgi:hypothetical protein
MAQCTSLVRKKLLRVGELRSRGSLLSNVLVFGGRCTLSLVNWEEASDTLRCPPRPSNTRTPQDTVYSPVKLCASFLRVSRGSVTDWAGVVVGDMGWVRKNRISILYEAKSAGL